MFVSIDIDFWGITGEWITPGSGQRFFKWMCEFSRGMSGKPLACVMNHQQMLPQVNESKSRVLFNLDFHSDLYENPKALTCATWVSYVKWRMAGRYIWFHGSDGYDGLCGTDTLRHDAVAAGWRWATDKRSVRAPDPVVLARKADEACICLSPGYSNGIILDAAYEVVKRFRIPYKKGSMADANERNILPPIRFAC